MMMLTSVEESGKPLLCMFDVVFMSFLCFLAVESLIAHDWPVESAVLLKISILGIK